MTTIDPPPPAAPRKGARRLGDVSDALREALEQGTCETATLTEGLALDFARLARHAFPQLPDAALADIANARDDGIVKRMQLMGRLLSAHLGADGVSQCRQHRADTVRGWGCFMIGADPALSLPQRLAAIQPFADDGHFGVREWAWLAVRPQLADTATTLADSIRLLSHWTGHPSAYIRRFASEALRPRGVWCAHIAALKRDPGPGLAILAPLRADPSPYVQDSVANWLNDAAKSRPDWVRACCAEWLRANPSPATQRICQRALRNLKQESVSP